MAKHFSGQLENETIVAVIHRHWFNILSHFLTILIFGILAFLFFFLAPLVTAALDITLSTSLLFFITSTIFLFLWVYAFFIWIDYYFDVWIITDERILNIEQKGLFTRVASEVNFGRVQDVTTKIEGFLPTMLDYGDILIQTAGEDKRFHFRNVGLPETHKDTIVALVKKYQDRNLGPVRASEAKI
jgi:uncharacterized membrane protein YdbT with pleckstrin-like domain